LQLRYSSTIWPGVPHPSSRDRPSRRPPRTDGRCGRRGWSVGRVLFPESLRRSVRRPSIYDRRCRRPRAVHPRTRAGSPRTCAVRPCSGRGLPSRPGRPGRWWSLAPPFHPYLPRPNRWEAVCSLWHCPADHSGWVLPTALPWGARTFLDTWSYQLIPARCRGRPTNPSASRSLGDRTPGRPGEGGRPGVLGWAPGGDGRRSADHPSCIS
jgi:hypothetical protein